MNEPSPGLKRLLPVLSATLFLLCAGVLIGLTGIPQVTEETVAVRFTLDAPDASHVAVVGDFNDWDPEATPLHKKDGIWQAEISLKKGNTYLYNFLIDRQKWITDPNRSNVINDGFGGKSVLEL